MNLHDMKEEIKHYPRTLIWVGGVSTATLLLQILEMKAGR